MMTQATRREPLLGRCVCRVMLEKKAARHPYALCGNSDWCLLLPPSGRARAVGEIKVAAARFPCPRHKLFGLQVRLSQTHRSTVRSGSQHTFRDCLGGHLEKAKPWSDSRLHSSTCISAWHRTETQELGTDFSGLPGVLTFPGATSIPSLLSPTF